MHWFWWVLLSILALFILLVSCFFCFLHISTSKDEKSNFKKECEKRERGELPAFKSDDWGIILGAPYAISNNIPCNEYSAEIVLNYIKSKHSWGIKNRQDLIYQLFCLIFDHHSTGYYKMRNLLVEMPKNEFETLIADIQQSQMRKSAKKELIWQYNMMYNNINDIQNVKYLSWDYVRFSMLCLEGCRLKYITETEAKSWSLMLAPLLREIYSGWDDLWHHFIITRWFWSAQDDKWTRSQSMYSSIVDELLQENGSPATTIEWNTPLPPIDTLSFAEAVASLQLADEDGEIFSVEALNETIQSYLNITDTH
ncbi:DUF1266 domain-containing protein [Xenorhabdus griffiniae]|uniref:DUF1266 domain-containing protein n=1 Tax=Xenorhabdus griffiniae TaxID=351672 RepID=UPI0030CC1F49